LYDVFAIGKSGRKHLPGLTLCFLLVKKGGGKLCIAMHKTRKSCLKTKYFQTALENKNKITLL